MSDVTASRKTVTVIFADLVESTSLAERLDPEALARLLDAYFIEMRSIIDAHGGTVEKFIGDAIVECSASQWFTRMTRREQSMPQ